MISVACRRFNRENKRLMFRESSSSNMGGRDIVRNLWLLTSVIPALKRLRQGDCSKIKVCLVFRVKLYLKQEERKDRSIATQIRRKSIITSEQK